LLAVTLAAAPPKLRLAIAHFDKHGVDRPHDQVDFAATLARWRR
jgi:hypothetical protein